MGFAFPADTPTSLRRDFVVAPSSGSDAPRGVDPTRSDELEKPEPSRANLRQAVDAAKRRFGELMEALVTEAASPVEPKDLLDLEAELHRTVARDCVDPVVGAVIQDLHNGDEIRIRATVLRLNRPHMHLQKSNQRVAITLLGGSKVDVLSPYYLSRPPRRRGRPRTKKGRKKAQGNGLYPVLAVLGLRFRMSPALVSEVARLVALSTIEQAADTLARRGVQLDRKVIRRIAITIAEGGLSYRDWLEQRTQDGARGHHAKGKRLVIGSDGGRVRIRYPKKRGRRRKTGRKGYDGQWKEPKVLVVYEVDETGRKVRGGLCRYDATMRDANGFFTVLTALLREIGAHEAKEWIIVGDGANWIWDRIPGLIEALDFDPEKVTQVVDFYHAVQRLHEIAAECSSWSNGDRKKWVRRMKRLLRRDHVDELLEQRTQLFNGRNSKKRRKLFDYFVDRADKMRYFTFRKRGVPLGSGAVESCVRRVVNLRLKGNGIFWNLDTAEGVLHLRAQLLCGRWDDFIHTVLRPQEVWSLGGSDPYEVNRGAALAAIERGDQRSRASESEVERKAA